MSKLIWHRDSMVALPHKRWRSESPCGNRFSILAKPHGQKTKYLAQDFVTGESEMFWRLAEARAWCQNAYEKE